MPRYHFHTEDGSTVPDPDGVDLADLRSARIEAVRLMGKVIADDPNEILSTRSFVVKVTDTVGLLLFVLELHAQDRASLNPPVGTVSPPVGPAAGR